MTTSAHLEGPNRADENNIFTLSGPSLKLDPSCTPLRGDLADISLAGKVFAPHYAVPMPMRAVSDTPLLSDLDTAAAVIAPLVEGSEFAALDIVGNYIWGYMADGGLVGFVAKDALVKVEIA